MTADPDIRALRRLAELEAKQISATFEQVKENLLQRDYEDMNREESPLRKAQDAIVLDNSHLDREQQLAIVEQLATELIEGRKKPVAERL